MKKIKTILYCSGAVLLLCGLAFILCDFSTVIGVCFMAAGFGDLAVAYITGTKNSDKA